MSDDEGSNLAGLAKIRRAFQVRDELRDLLEKLLTADRKYTRRDNNSERYSRTVWAEWTLDEVPDYTQSSLLMGDTIHNLRAAMDHAVWAVTPSRIQGTCPRDVAFPLHTSEEGFKKWLRKRKTWYGPTVVEVLDSQQPYHAGTAKLHPLHILQYLSNTDKHQLLNVVANNAVAMSEVRVYPHPPGGVKSAVHEGVVSPGVVLARAEFIRPVDKSEVELVPTFAFEQVFRYIDPAGDERWLPLGDAMNQVCPAVVTAVGYIASAHEKDVNDGCTPKA
ncbi:hypothetical protein JGU71_21645 [Antrihabitans sp. YC3-6]|uniref:Uncharacterized protein n=1 Tax=Antrihabitans stalagmiti TaxID=2799499 RepID=A0A934NU67_9NOCA|nr:hypothetical protein [Antrihabitans stalagmiti]MBJ8341496.1 hypothetical protein [Antrihabitans stalagmiti]